MEKEVCIIGAGLAGSEAALQLAKRKTRVSLIEARPGLATPVHKTDYCAELVCSNSLKSEKTDSAAGLIKYELSSLKSFLYGFAIQSRVPAGGALAVDRNVFAESVTQAIENHPYIRLIRAEAIRITQDGCVECSNGANFGPFHAIVVASGPLTSESLADWLLQQTGSEGLSFYDAAAPIVYEHSLNHEKIFKQSRYEEGEGDYLNAPFTRDEYETFINELISARRVIAKDFESKDLFQACQPIEEIARKGIDAPRYGPLKPVGLTDPRTGKRPWAAVQLRAEDPHGQSYNLVGFQTNLAFPEQERVFRLIPGLEQAEFVRYGVMHRNTFLDAPRLMTKSQELRALKDFCSVPVYLAGQISGTEGYCEAIRAGLQVALEITQHLRGRQRVPLPPDTVYGALLSYATNPDTQNYQPMHVNFGIMPPLDHTIKNKKERYAAYAQRAMKAIDQYASQVLDL
ncbi:MAG: methylenetetrahydrofolate--tRNA-(uracil(54)-C(5))-methyltransferase (FADH(2)-oxidizing) TrmFO [Eggerthellaceae bacterium]|nr:methylenetetrahydrofolate--tRNA-(uracil(54)-C(5))-methyltransferase (FADH(2)-oxidizing) TrmFO [Eggerthellaceae bacterium]